MANVSLKNIDKAYGAVRVIEGLNLEIADKEFVVLVGPSGCGKTTTLRMIAGLETVTGGEVRIGERDVTYMRPGQRDCAMVFQSYALYPHMSVRENIAYGMKVRGTPKADREAAIEKASNILGLAPYLDRKPKALSGGQRQRVAIGRAIVREPEVFLFDEPLSNLDAKLRIETRAEIKDLHRRLQTTIVYVTHDQVEAMTLADRVVVMRDGRIEQAADPITLYEEPANAFVATFIGAPSMNMIPATVVEEAGTIGLRLATGDVIAVPPGKAPALAGSANRSVTFGIRPENAGDVTGAARADMVVDTIEPLGPHTLVLGHIGEAAVTAQMNPRARPELGSTVPVHFDTDRMHLFDGETGAAIR